MQIDRATWELAMRHAAQHCSGIAQELEHEWPQRVSGGFRAEGARRCAESLARLPPPANGSLAVMDERSGPQESLL